MNFSPTVEVKQVHIAAEAGVAYKPAYRDPIAAWVDLMDVVEALCLRRPDRPSSISHIFVL